MLTINEILPEFFMNYKFQVESRLKKLLIESIEGNRKSYELFLKEIQIIFVNFLKNKIREKENIEDLVQEILISIHNGRHTYDSSLPVLNWIFSIAYRRYVDFLRKKERINKYEFYTETFEQFQTNIYLDNEDRFIERDKINRILDKMPEKDRKIIQLLKFENYSIREISKILGKSESAVKVAAHRAYKKLKNIIETETGYE